jgi:hypothetical protein
MKQKKIIILALSIIRAMEQCQVLGLRIRDAVYDLDDNLVKNVNK